MVATRAARRSSSCLHLLRRKSKVKKGGKKGRGEGKKKMRNRGLSKEGKIYTKPPPSPLKAAALPRQASSFLLFAPSLLLSLSLSRDAKLFSAIATGSCQKVERARLVKRGTTWISNVARERKEGRRRRTRVEEEEEEDILNFLRDHS